MREQHGPARSLPHLAGDAGCNMPLGSGLPGQAEAEESGAGAGRGSPRDKPAGSGFAEGAEPHLHPLHPLWPEVLLLSTAIAQGACSETEALGQHLCSSQRWGQDGKPFPRALADPRARSGLPSQGATWPPSTTSTRCFRCHHPSHQAGYGRGLCPPSAMAWQPQEKALSFHNLPAPQPHASVGHVSPLGECGSISTSLQDTTREHSG